MVLVGNEGLLAGPVAEGLLEDQPTTRWGAAVAFGHPGLAPGQFTSPAGEVEVEVAS
jgi:hypothetical protein